MFVKVFDQIFDSSIAEDWLARHVFMDLLILADRDGVVDITAEAIARRTNVPLKHVIHALKQLSSPDLKSRSKECEGRRIVLIDSHRDWGWQIVNYEHYRNLRDESTRREYFRDAKREQRERSKAAKKEKPPRQPRRPSRMQQLALVGQPPPATPRVGEDDQSARQ
jgi:hypothetical protein